MDQKEKGACVLAAMVITLALDLSKLRMGAKLILSLMINSSQIPEPVCSLLICMHLTKLTHLPWGCHSVCHLACAWELCALPNKEAKMAAVRLLTLSCSCQNERRVSKN